MPRESARCGRSMGVLAPAALSACVDASSMVVPTAGALVSTVLQELSKAFMLKKWFHGMMSTKEAEALMMEKGKNGSFLVRESYAHPGEFVLTVRSRGRVSHVTIRRQHDKYEVGSGEQFEDLVGLIEHFRSYPIIENSGAVLRLLQPISGTAIKIQDIQKKVQEIKSVKKIRNGIGYSLDREFMSLRNMENQNIFSTIEGDKKDNESKNRYGNILPYDQTRVILKDNLQGTDYINANYIRPLSDVNSSPQSSCESLDFDKLNDKIYIATQGCLSNTIDDFWHMIWQEDVRVIAMITEESERGKSKCERYWPELGTCDSRAYLSIKLEDEILRPHYTFRKLKVSDAMGHSRIIFHYQYTAWPDHGIPTDTSKLLNFIQDINTTLDTISTSVDATRRNILCVHCSAGVGRTGTFIALDMLIDCINRSGSKCNIDIHSTVKLLRAQRVGMVQNKTQYKFLYIALQEYICNINTKRKKTSEN